MGPTGVVHEREGCLLNSHDTVSLVLIYYP